MRPDAARLKGCFGSCFPSEAVTRSPRCSTTKGFRRTRLSAGFFVSGVHFTAPWIGGLAPLILKTWNFSPLSRSSVRSSRFSQFCEPFALAAGCVLCGGAAERLARHASSHSARRCYMMLQGFRDYPGQAQSPLCVALLIDFVKPDDVIAGITSNGVPVREVDIGSSPVNG